MDQRLQQNNSQRENILNRNGQQRQITSQNDGQIHSQSQNQILQRRVPLANNNSAQTSDQQQSLEELNDLIKIQKKRQENYLQLLDTFRKKNIIPGQMQIISKEWLNLFSQVRTQEIQRIQEENPLIRQYLGMKIEDSRQKMFVTRFCMRICELYEQGNMKLKSLALFDAEKEKLAKQYLENVHKQLKQQTLELEPILINLIRSFIKNINEELEYAKQLMTSTNSIIMMGEEIEEQTEEDCLKLPLPNHPDLQQVCRSIIDEEDLNAQYNISTNPNNIAHQNNFDYQTKYSQQNIKVGQDFNFTMKQQKSFFNFYEQNFFKLYDILALDKPFIKQQISSLRVGNQDKFLIELTYKNSLIQDSLKDYIETANASLANKTVNLMSKSSPNLLQPQTLASPKKRSKNHQSYIKKLLNTCFFGFEQNTAPSKNKIKQNMMKSEKILQQQIVSLSQIPYSINVIPSQNDLSQNDKVLSQNNINPSSQTNINPPNNSITTQNNTNSSQNDISPLNQETTTQIDQQQNKQQQQQNQSTAQIQNKPSTNNIGQKQYIQIRLYSTDCIQQVSQNGNNVFTQNTKGILPIKQDNEIVQNEQNMIQKNNQNQQNQVNSQFSDHKLQINNENTKNIIFGKQTMYTLPQYNFNQNSGNKFNKSNDNHLNETQKASNSQLNNSNNQIQQINQQQFINTSTQFVPIKNQISKDQQVSVTARNIIQAQTSCNGFVQGSVQQQSTSLTTSKIQNRSSPPKNKKIFSKEFEQILKTDSIISEAQKQVQIGLSNLLGIETKTVKNNILNQFQNNNNDETLTNNSNPNQNNIHKNGTHSCDDQGAGSNRYLSPIQQRIQQYQKANNILNNKQLSKENPVDHFQNSLPKLNDSIILAIKASPLSQPQTSELYPNLYNLSKTICEDEFEEDDEIRKINYMNTDHNDDKNFCRNKKSPNSNYRKVKEVKIKENDKAQNIISSNINRGFNKFNTSSEKQSPQKNRNIIRKSSQDKSSLNTPVKCVNQKNKSDFSSEIKTIYDAQHSINCYCKNSIENRVNASFNCDCKNITEDKVKKISQEDQQFVKDNIKIKPSILNANSSEEREEQSTQGGSPQKIPFQTSTEKVGQEIEMQKRSQTQSNAINFKVIAEKGEDSEQVNKVKLNEQSIQEQNIKNKNYGNNIQSENQNILQSLQEQKQNINSSYQEYKQNKTEQKSSSSSSSSYYNNGNLKQNQFTQKNRVVHINPMGNYILKQQQNNKLNISRGKSTQERANSTNQSQQNNSSNQVQQNQQQSQKHHQSNSYSSSCKKQSKFDIDENLYENIEKDYILQKIQNSTQLNKDFDQYSKDSKQFVGNNSKDVFKNSNNNLAGQLNSPYLSYNTQYVLSQEDDFDQTLNQFKVSHNTLAFSSNKKGMNYRNQAIQYRSSFHNINNNNNSAFQNNNSQNNNNINKSNQYTNNQSLNYYYNSILNYNNNQYFNSNINQNNQNNYSVINKHSIDLNNNKSQNLNNNNNQNIINNGNTTLNNEQNINQSFKNGQNVVQHSRSKSSHDNNTFAQNQYYQQLPFQINFKTKNSNQPIIQQKNAVSTITTISETGDSSNKNQTKEGNVKLSNLNNSSKQIKQGEVSHSETFSTVAAQNTNTCINGQKNQSQDCKDQNTNIDNQDSEQTYKINSIKLHSKFYKTQFKEIMDNFHTSQNVNQQQAEKNSPSQQPQMQQNIFQKVSNQQNQIKTKSGEKNIQGVNQNQYSSVPFSMNGQNNINQLNSSQPTKRSNNFMKQSTPIKKEINLPKIFNSSQPTQCPFSDANYNTKQEIQNSPNKQTD